MSSETATLVERIGMTDADLDNLLATLDGAAAVAKPDPMDEVESALQDIIKNAKSVEPEPEVVAEDPLLTAILKEVEKPAAPVVEVVEEAAVAEPPALVVEVVKSVEATAPKPKRQRRAKAPAQPSIDYDTMVENFEEWVNRIMEPGNHGLLTTDSEWDPIDANEIASKIGNKKRRIRVLNLLLWLTGQRNCLVYTRRAVQALIDAGADGLTWDELKAVYEQSALAQSTADSQAYHYWEVLPTLKIANLSRKIAATDEDRIYVNQQSTIVQKWLTNPPVG